MPALLIAHRGDSASAPENTIPAFQRAAVGGADWIELDLRLSKDGVPVVIHDDRLWRRAMRRGRVGDLTAQELATIDVSRGFHQYRHTGIPTLAQVLSGVGRRLPLYLELKSSGRGRRDSQNRALLERVLDQVPARSRHALASFDPGLVRGALQGGRRAVLILKDPDMLGRLDKGERSQLHAVSVRHDRLQPGLVAKVARTGAQLWAWTTDGERNIRRALERGATAVCSNDVTQARRVLDELATEREPA